ncbi:hypothetical protein CO2235_U920015 [Cupriavidus oxalaticus]|nr:hypothetical protein CO2235_U920015 [Cupriavidus oxalaticus]
MAQDQRALAEVGGEGGAKEQEVTPQTSRAVAKPQVSDLPIGCSLSRKRETGATRQFHK